MSTTPHFTPRRYELSGVDAPPGMDKLEELENTLTALEKEIHIEASSRRVMAAHLMRLGWHETPHLAEHIACSWRAKPMP